MNYYNEWEPKAASELRGMIAEGLVAQGVVDERSIVDVTPGDLAGFIQCHFFAGLGGWSIAARMAGWPDKRGLWTGSPPCQPFSGAGLGRGDADERHLWPHFFRLIRACRPAVCMGEQVAQAIGMGWLDGVQSDMEECDYAFRPVVLPACCVDAPHKRERIYFVAHANEQRAQVPLAGQFATEQVAGGNLHSHWQDARAVACDDGKTRRLAPCHPMLANGLPGANGLVRAYGNAIVPQVAAEVIGAYLECYP